VYVDEVDFRKDPRGREYLWIGGPSASHRPVVGSDTEAYDEGVVGVTPLVLDLWGRDHQERAEFVVSAVQKRRESPVVQ
jgi:5'-nucleotidase